MYSPLVSIVIVTWNRREDVLQAVCSVVNQAYDNYEIVVVDNSSTDGTAEALRQAYPDVRVVALDRNMGPTGGRNEGINVARGEIIFFLDSDATLGQNTLVATVSKFQADPNLGVIACKVINAYTRQLDNIAGWIFSENDKVDQDLEFLSFSFSECGSAIRRQTIDQAGLFWDFLFFGREGEELSLRVWDAGYKILYCPETVVYHHVSPSKRIEGGEREYFNLRNCLYIYLVRFPWWMVVYFAAIKIGVSTLRGIRHSYLLQVLRALGDVLTKLPYLWQKRQPIRNETARFYIQLQREHGPLRWNLTSWFKHKF